MGTEAFEQRAVISGVGQSAIGRQLDRSGFQLTLDAILAAVEDAGLTVDDIDGLAMFPGGGKANWHPFLRRHPPLGDLLRGAARLDRGRSMVGDRYEVDGVPVDVVELTGAPGDVVITHLHVFHCGPPNTSDSPRYMLGKGALAA